MKYLLSAERRDGAAFATAALWGSARHLQSVLLPHQMPHQMARVT